MLRTALLLAVVITAPLRAQSDRVSPPGAQETYAAYATLETWVRAWEVPVERAMIDPERTSSACVTLRLAGKVIGRGTHVSSDGDAVWAAARQAWLESQNRLPVPNDATRDEAVLGLAPLVMIDLEIGGGFVPLLGESYADASLSVSPGLAGVAARAGERSAAMFPGAMLAQNSTPELALRSCVSELGLPPEELGALRSSRGVSVARFDTVHLAQPRGGQPPVFLTRGSKAAPQSEVAGPALREAALGMARHLMSHEWPGREAHGMSGDYIATTGRYDPPIAPARTQAIASYALLRFAQTPGIDEAVRARATVFAQQVLAELTDVTASETSPLADVVDTAAWLLADEHAREGVAYREATATFREEAMRTLLDAMREPEALRRRVSPPERALIAASAATIAGTGDALPQAESLARDLTLALYREAPEGQVVALLPWVAIASIELATGGAPFLGDTKLRESRANIWTFQVDASEIDPSEADLAGGIVFTRGRNPFPTWHSLRPLAFVAMTLGEREITDQTEFMPQFSHLARSLRFVIQLTVREPDLHMMQAPDRALGGVRLATWDARVSVDATSMGLLTVCETLIAVEDASRRRR